MSRTLRAVIALAMILPLAGLFTGCGDPDAPVKVEFPPGTKPLEPSKTSAAGAAPGAASSAGDPGALSK
jgi:hypothetical protein